MGNCADIERIATLYVDGDLAAAERAAVEAHLAGCPACRARVGAEMSARHVVRARAEALRPAAPEALRARCAALAPRMPGRPAAARAASTRRPLFTRRVVPLMAAAALLLVLVGVLAYTASRRGDGLLAAQLTLDHVKCFMTVGDAAQPASHAEVEAALAARFGTDIRVPAGSPAEDLVLVGARRCLSSEGRVAHVLYQFHGRPLSLFMLPGLAARRREIEMIGHEAIIWPAARATYVLVGGASREELRRVADYCAKRTD